MRVFPLGKSSFHRQQSPGDCSPLVPSFPPSVTHRIATNGSQQTLTENHLCALEPKKLLPRMDPDLR